MGWTWLDLDLINQIRQVCPKLPFTEAIALILESRVSGGEEAHCRANLRRMLGGTIEVPAGKFGKIDLLTSCGKLIEVKRVSRAAHAIGQVLCYHTFFPLTIPYIALFGKKWYHRSTVHCISGIYNLGLIWISTVDDTITFERYAETERLDGKEVWKTPSFGAVARAKERKSEFSLPM